MSLRNYLPVFEYDFRKDEVMQQLGNQLFPQNQTIAISKGTRGKDIISFLLYEDEVTANRSIRRNTPYFKIYYYSEFDKAKDWYNLIVLIESTSFYEIKYHAITIPGNRPDEQNHLLDILGKRHATEIWYSNYAKTFLAVKAPIEEEVKDLNFLKKLIQKNFNEMKECPLCGGKFSQYVESEYCPDCISRMIVENNR